MESCGICVPTSAIDAYDTSLEGGVEKSQGIQPLLMYSSYVSCCIVSFWFGTLYVWLKRCENKLAPRCGCTLVLYHWGCVVLELTMISPIFNIYQYTNISINQYIKISIYQYINTYIYIYICLFIYLFIYIYSFIYIRKNTVECLVNPTISHVFSFISWAVSTFFSPTFFTGPRHKNSWDPPCLRPNAPPHPGHESLALPTTMTRRSRWRRRCRRGPARRGPMRSCWMPWSWTGLEAMDQWFDTYLWINTWSIAIISRRWTWTYGSTTIYNSKFWIGNYTC